MKEDNKLTITMIKGYLKRKVKLMKANQVKRMQPNQANWIQIIQYNELIYKEWKLIHTYIATHNDEIYNNDTTH